jgi:hypothetical protein
MYTVNDTRSPLQLLILSLSLYNDTVLLHVNKGKLILDSRYILESNTNRLKYLGYLTEVFFFLQFEIARMLYSEKDLRSITTGEEKFFDSAKKPALRYRHATFASGSSSFRTSVGTEFLKVSPIQKRGNSTAQYPHLVRMTLCPLTQHPFLVIKAALKKDCKQEVEFCFLNRVYLNTDLYTFSALMKALNKRLTTHLILTIKLRASNVKKLIPQNLQGQSKMQRRTRRTHNQT